MKTDLNGLIFDLDNQTYHDSPGLSSSMLVKLMRSPAHLREAIINPPEQTPAMKFGSAAHAAILEPNLFAGRYVKAPECDRRTKAGKETYESFAIENQGKEILSGDDFDKIKAMVDAVHSHPVASGLLKNGKAEMSAFWRDPNTNLLCKCRPDYYNTKNGIIVDVKTSEDASFKGFQKSISKFNYHIQSAFYLDGISTLEGRSLTDFVHLVVEKEAPHAVGLYVLDDASLDRAREDIKKLLEIYNECVSKNEWPAYANEIQNMNLPAWMF